MASPIMTPIPGQHEYAGMQMGPIFTDDVLDRIRGEFTLESSDVLISGYPKSGTTWLQEIMWLIWNDVDTERANTESVWDRIPLLESAPPGQKSGLDICLSQAHPRLVKTHLPVWFWQDKLDQSGAKVVTVMRNPKDQLVSYYHFVNMAYPGCIEWNQWFDNIRVDKMLYGGWVDHIKGWWTEYVNKPNALFLKYEEMKKDIRHTIQTLAKFLNKPLTEQQIEAIISHTSFNNMKSNPATNLKEVSYLNQSKTSFIRSGKVGGWTDWFSEEQSDFLDKLVSQKLAGTGLHFEDQ